MSKIIGVILAFLLFFAFQIFLLEYFWNWIAVDQGAKPIGFLDAAGMLILARTLIPTGGKSTTVNNLSLPTGPGFGTIKERAGRL